MTIEEARKRGVFTTRILLAKAWDVVPELSAKEAELKELFAEEWVEMREPSGAQSVRMQKSGDAFEPKIEIAAECTIGSSFAHDGGGAVTGKEVWELIAGSLTLLRYVLDEWQESIPLVRRNAFLSAKSLSSTSTADASRPGK